MHSNGPYPADYPVRIGEFWTSRQRQMSSLHEVSYRACFKAELPAWFIERYTQPGDVVYDPFAGRGTTAIQASLQGRRFISNDLSPLSRILAEPRISPPSLTAVARRLTEIDLGAAAGREAAENEHDLAYYYNQQTLVELCNLRSYLQQQRTKGIEDGLDAWIRMVATNRLTGHSKGFFSVYTLPPNQATLPARQQKINEKYNNDFSLYKDVKQIILRKSKQLLSDCPKGLLGMGGLFLTCDAADTYFIASGSVDLLVTSPPFLNVVQYEIDNWLRLWFNCIEPDKVSSQMLQTNKLAVWEDHMKRVFQEFHRVLAVGAHGAFEVGEVQRGKLKLDEVVYPLLVQVGLLPQETMINSQGFTKTSNIWGVANNRRGTNSNRIVVFRR